jgi:hypothetical protein
MKIIRFVVTLDISRLSFEDDSFKKFTDDIVKKYMKEEELRSSHQVNKMMLKSF